jgi:uncharacterized protein (TIRG00374 family)
MAGTAENRQIIGHAIAQEAETVRASRKTVSEESPTAQASHAAFGSVGKKKLLTSWISWLFGVALVIAVVLLAAHRTEGREFADLVAHARPLWLLLGLLPQMGTYVAEARIWQQVVLRADISRTLRSYIGLAFANLFMNQVLPSGGLSGTLLVVRSLDQRGISRGASMAAIVVGLVSYYAAYVLALGITLGIVWAHKALTLFIALPVAIFLPVAVGIPAILLVVSRGRTLPHWIARLPLIRTALQALAEAVPGVAHDFSLIARCTGLQIAIFLFDAGTLWIMLFALGHSLSPAPVFASFMLSSLAQTLGPMPGGLGVFEAASVVTLKLMGIPIAVGLAATLLFRGFSFWLPLLPGAILAHEASKAGR